MNKYIMLLIIALSFPLLLVISCQSEEPGPIAVKAVYLNATSVELTEGETVTLEATISPNDAENKILIWSSSNLTVASVSNEGKVTALKAGKATITVQTEDGGKTASCELTVNARVYPVIGIYIDRKTVTLTEGDNLNLIATIKPDNASNKSVSWASSDNSVATVSNEGKVTALKAGKATITVRTDDGGKTATCEVTVDPRVYPVTSVSLDKTSAALIEGDDLTLTATIKPDNASNKSVSWASSDNSVATVSDEGKVTTLKAGKATITVRTDDGGKTATCEVTVDPRVYPVTSVSLDKASATLTEGDKITLTATIKPDNATNKNLSWSSSNPSVASVDNGRVTALKAGNTIISVKTEDGNMTANCNITVIEPPKATSLTLSTGYINGFIYRDHSKLYPISVTAHPSNAVADYEWNSSNTRVAKVEGNGSSANIYTEDYGESTITVTDRRTGLSASMTIYTVVENFTWEETTNETMFGDPVITVYLNEEHKLKCSYTPSYATKVFFDLEQFVFYENNVVVDKPTYISITDEGVVTGLKVGIMAIKPTGRVIKAANTNRLYIKIIERIIPVTSVVLDKTSATLTEGDKLTLTATIRPDNATNKNLSWSSSNPSVASVVNGRVTALKAGYAKISVKTEDGNKTANCNITVIEPPKATSLTLSNGYINGYIYRDHSKLYSISVTAHPSNAVADYEWNSSNTRVAKVEGKGSSANIYTEDYGESTITVTDRRTGLSASMKIHTVVEDFTWEETTNETMFGDPMITIYLNEEHKLNCSYTPSYATKVFSDLEQFVFYENNVVVDKPTYISITDEGVVTGRKLGIVGIKPTGLIIKEFNTDRLYIQVKERK